MSQNPIALVTGTRVGIGAAVARTLLEHGWHVQGLSRGPASIEAEGYEHSQVDLGDQEALTAWAERMRPHLASAPRVALVNNAAILDPVGPQAGIDLAALDQHLRVNLTAPIWLAGFAREHTPAETPLIIVQISSGAAFKAYSGWTAYCTAKAGLKMGSEVLAAEVEAYGGGTNLSVVNYQPGVVATDMQAKLRSLSDEQFPMRPRFVALHEDGDLVDAQGPADEIVRLCEQEELEPYLDLRFTPASS